MEPTLKDYVTFFKNNSQIGGVKLDLRKPEHRALYLSNKLYIQESYRNYIINLIYFLDQYPDDTPILKLVDQPLENLIVFDDRVEIGMPSSGLYSDLIDNPAPDEKIKAINIKEHAIYKRDDFRNLIDFVYFMTIIYNLMNFNENEGAKAIVNLIAMATLKSLFPGNSFFGKLKKLSKKNGKKALHDPKKMQELTGEEAIVNTIPIIGMEYTEVDKSLRATTDRTPIESQALIIPKSLKIKMLQKWIKNKRWHLDECKTLVNYGDLADDFLNGIKTIEDIEQVFKDLL